MSMPDRSSHQGLPEEWNHGSHAARGPFSGPGASEGYGAGTGSYRAGTPDGFGTGPTDAFGAVTADAPGTRTDSYGTGTTDAFGVRTPGTYGVGAGDRFGDADPFGPRAAGPFGPPAADPYGPPAADPFGPPAADPFGPATTSAFATAAAEAGTARPEAERPMVTTRDPAPGQTADARGFLGALFDFGFTSFVTPRVIKVLYMLIVAGTALSALVFTIIAFKASLAFGILTLVFGDPLFILIVLAIYRIILEFFVITFRVAEDIRALRERGDLR
jgi:Domain of unknown function (DUF4282)